MKIEKEQVKRIASLAHLEIDDSEQERWSEQMGAIIEFANALGELDLSESEAEACAGARLFNVFREDECAPSFEREKLLSCAPKQYEGCYVVPKIVE